MTLLSLKIDGMSCGGCEQSVEKAIGNLPGITNVKADHITGQVKVEFFNHEPATETLTQTLDKIGFHLSKN